MAIAAKISPSELTAQVTDRFVGKYYEARLIDSAGTTYTPGTTDDATFLALEVPIGTGGYDRVVFAYEAGDITAYTDDGVALQTKGTVFAHDNSATALDFNQAVLVESSGCVTALASPVSAFPSAGVNGTYTNLPTSTTGSGSGLTVDLTITNAGVANTDWVLTINSPGYGYTAADPIQVQEADLVSVGAVAVSAGNLDTTASTVYTSATAGDLLAVAELESPVSLVNGRETVFYWNLKQFGFYSV